MTDEMIALGRRAVACKGWRWMNGMLLLDGDRVTERTLAVAHSALPDLSDPATMGCLLHLVQEAWGAEVTACFGWDGEGYLTVHSRYFDEDDDSLAGAAVAALEAVPNAKCGSLTGAWT